MMFRHKLGVRGRKVGLAKLAFSIRNSGLVNCRVPGPGSRAPKSEFKAEVFQTAVPDLLPQSPRPQQGFTLIEVMAAFAIFAVLFGVILQILSTSVSNTRRSGDFTQAALIAQAQLDMVGIEEIPLPGSYSGQESERYRWVMDIEPYFVASDSGVNYDELPIDLYRVVLTVYWGENDSERSATFQTLRSVDRFYAERQLDGG